MRKRLCAILLAIGLSVLCAAAMADGLASVSLTDYHNENGLWYYSYTLTNSSAAAAGIFDFYLLGIDDAYVTDSPLGWTPNYVSDKGGEADWYTDNPAYAIGPGASLSGFQIASPWNRNPGGTATALMLDADMNVLNGEAGGPVDGPSTPEASTWALLLSGCGMAGLLRRRVTGALRGRA